LVQPRNLSGYIKLRLHEALSKVQIGKDFSPPFPAKVRLERKNIFKQ
jgi:hypothetical protein